MADEGSADCQGGGGGAGAGGQSLLRHLHQARLLAQSLPAAADAVPDSPGLRTDGDGAAHGPAGGEGGAWEVAACREEAAAAPLALGQGAPGDSGKRSSDAGGAESPGIVIHLLPSCPDSLADGAVEWEWSGADGGDRLQDAWAAGDRLQDPRAADGRRGAGWGACNIKHDSLRVQEKTGEAARRRAAASGLAQCFVFAPCFPLCLSSRRVSRAASLAFSSVRACVRACACG